MRVLERRDAKPVLIGVDQHAALVVRHLVGFLCLIAVAFHRPEHDVRVQAVIERQNRARLAAVEKNGFGGQRSRED